MKPSTGSTAPDFTAPVAGVGIADDATVTLSGLRGQRVVLMFYPKDDTPGCTQQACAMRDMWDQVKSKAVLYGVSIDPIRSHRKFVEKHQLPYPLISDEDQKIVESYGVWVEKSMYGKKYMGTERTTFVIAPDGTVEAVLEKVSAKDHWPLLEAALA